MPQPEHAQFSVIVMVEHVRAQLVSMPSLFDGHVEKSARVFGISLVSGVEALPAFAPA